MKKIGILFGQETTFPPAFVERVNSKEEKGITAEFVKIDKVAQGELSGYDVIIDRISQDVPFYRAYLKNAAVSGTAVINNPFWWSADEKFFNNALMTKLGVAVPKTVLLPSNQHPDDTDENSFRNLNYPMNWDAIFSYIGFPAFFKPFAGGGWKNVYHLNSPDDFFKAYNETGQLVMMLQEEINFTEYFRCYSLDRKDFHIMRYEPKRPHHLRYVQNPKPVDKSLMEKMKKTISIISNSLGYDFNTIELAVRDSVPYAIDFCNPAPDADKNSVGEANFEWIVEAASNMALRRAKAHKAGQNNLTWGSFIKNFANNKALSEL
ncbi:MAG: hypothetical protein KJN64_10570 [Ignavibacteria bacterium]|nr:hypothetical protein [Ignavibacteria bacterium]MBT8383198.1 hypothetical protein [Ignavibacteria bacterium]MBT8392539.1 hypothetical protein [Ignavibacteria bacterium]NNL21745.1 hypothetical protein [Ignavibacteriaceae bacterium]